MNELVEVVGFGLHFVAVFPIPRPVFRRYEVGESLHLPGHGFSRSISSRQGIVSRVPPEGVCQSCVENRASRRFIL